MVFKVKVSGVRRFRRDSRAFTERVRYHFNKSLEVGKEEAGRIAKRRFTTTGRFRGSQGLQTYKPNPSRYVKSLGIERGRKQRQKRKLWTFEGAIVSRHPKAKLIEYGAKRHIIVARRKAALSFYLRSGIRIVTTVVRHTGFRGRRILERAGKKAEKEFVDRMKRLRL